jgi:hypothetical protein
MDIERIRDEAKSALASGRAILDDISEGKITEEQIEEKQQQAQAFFDEAEQKAQRIKLYERAEGLEQTSVNGLKLGAPGDDGDDDPDYGRKVTSLWA